MTGILNLLAGAVGVVKDTYFNLVTLLLPGNGTNGAQNNTFLDSSTNNFTITRNGNTTQGTFSPFSQTGWGNYFGGSDYLSASSNTAFQLGTGDWTVEYFVFATSFSNSPSMVDTRVLSSGNGYSDYFNTSGKYLLFWANATKYTSTATLAVNTWYHIAVCRSSGTVSVYINGSRDGTFSDSTNLSDSNLRIGNNQGASNGLTGYLSSVRIVKGTAVYSGSTITVPTSALTNITNTSLLTCQSNRFIDNSSNAFALTATGTPSVQAFSPFAPTAAYSAATNGGSGYFDGAGDYLTFADAASLELSNNSFCIEFWINTTSSTAYAGLVARESTPAGAGMWSILLNNASSTAGDIAFWSHDYNSFASALMVTTGVSVRDGAWHHVAVVRNGSSWAIYIDGVSRATQTSTVTIANIGIDYWIGNDAANAAARAVSGYLSSLRYVVGSAVYTAGFTPPTAPLTAITNTSLLLNFTNAGITDATAKNDLETVGNAQISTTQSKFGGSSMYFDGTGDWATLPITPQTSLGTSYTIEAWVYLANTTGAKAIYSHSVANVASYGYLLFYVSGSSLGFYVRPSTGAAEAGLVAGTISATTWTHVSVSVDNNSARLFINGTQVGSTTTVSATTYTPVYSTVGADIVQGYPMNGYIDDLRITRGFARYTANFTPPTAAFALQ